MEYCVGMCKMTILSFSRIFLTAFSVSFGAVSCAEGKSEVIKDERPNIIVILADDLGYNDVGFTGETEIQTPVLDQLAEQGTVFENGYVTHPYCGPSRAGLLTGRYQARFGMENNVTFSPDDKYMGLPLDEVTLADRLKSVGYKTSIFGKWHLGAAPHFQPNERGFDYFYGFLDGGHMYFPDDVHVESNGYRTSLVRNKKPAEFTEYMTTALSRDAARYVKEFQDEPFFMYLSYNAPHTPLQAPDDLIEKYAHIADEDRRIYAAMIDSMDQGIGMVVEALKETDQLDNTLIFFLSDNGGVYPEEWQPNHDWSDNAPFRRGKVALLEGGIHVPFIAHWPVGLPSGQRVDGLVSSLDIAATSVALAGVDISDGLLDGVNLVPFIRGEAEGSPHKALYWRLEEADHIWAVRTMAAKYMNQTLPGVGLSFFNMIDDPAEQTNLVGKFPEQQAELAKLWNEWNAKNENSLLQQSWEYSASKAEFYEQLHQQNIKLAKERKPYVIE